jgi:DNA primase
VAVVEGYTDVIAAHQVGLPNVVGTLGTALGDDHVTALKRLAAQVVLIFDGDDAGQNAADRALELFLGHEVDVRVLTLPEKLDPCDFLLKEGAEAFRALVDRAVDPLAFAVRRAGERFDLESIEGSRQAAEWVLGVFARVPRVNRFAQEVKVDKALDTLSDRLRVPVPTLKRRLRQLQREAKVRYAPRASAPAGHDSAPAQVDPATADAPGEAGSAATSSASGSIQLNPQALDPTERELIQIVLSEPGSVGRVISRVSVASIHDASLRVILQVCYDLHGEGQPATFERVALRLFDDAVRALAACLLSPMDSGPRSDQMSPEGPWEERLSGVLLRLAKRDWQERLRELKATLDETSEADDPVSHRALWTEYNRLINQRPDTKKKTAS